jgi:hypothetical protein
VDGVTCPAENLCIATGLSGKVWSSSTPADASTWAAARVDGRHHVGIPACSSTESCIVVDHQGFFAVGRSA